MAEFYDRNIPLRETAFEIKDGIRFKVTIEVQKTGTRGLPATTLDVLKDYSAKCLKDVQGVLASGSNKEPNPASEPDPPRTDSVQSASSHPQAPDEVTKRKPLPIPIPFPTDKRHNTSTGTGTGFAHIRYRFDYTFPVAESGMKHRFNLAFRDVNIVWRDRKLPLKVYLEKRAAELKREPEEFRVFVNQVEVDAEESPESLGIPPDSEELSFAMIPVDYAVYTQPWY